jgi:hypothetical protein
MAKIFYKNLSDLQPIEFKYIFDNGEIKNSKLSLNDGYTFYQIDGLKNFQDLTINRETIFILTSTISLQDVFETSKNYKYGQLPGTILLQPQPYILYYAALESSTNTITLKLTGTQFYLSPVDNNIVEIFIEDSYLQIEEEYPFNAYTSIKSLPEENINRQRFECIFDINTSTITFKTLTKDGFRYLAFTPDNILRATGTMFNDSQLNNYIFKCIPITESNINTGIILANPWVTYFSSYEQELENRSLAVNKTYTPSSHFLLHLPVEQTVNTGVGIFNTINLRTGVTPTGGPSPVNNLIEN